MDGAGDKPRAAEPAMTALRWAFGGSLITGPEAAVGDGE